jgi:RNA polymerase sigma-70 factor, ECF subfamily
MGLLNDCPEVELVEQCLAGSQDAWDELHRRFRPLVERAVLKRKRVWKAAFPDEEDVVQDTFKNLQSALERYDPGYPLAKFIWGVADHTGNDVFGKDRTLRRGAAFHRADIEDCAGELSAGGNAGLKSPEELLQTEQLMAIVRRGIYDVLSDTCREAIVMRFFEDLSYAEMATALKETENTLNQRVKRCLERLKLFCRSAVSDECAARRRAG